MSIFSKPKILFMDEPTIGFDPLSKKSLFKMLKKLKLNDSSILMSTHRYDDA